MSLVMEDTAIFDIGFVQATRLHFILLLAVFCPVIAHAGDCSFDDFPVMAEMKLFPVLNDAVHNNRPMMVKGYTVDAPLEQVVSYYQKEWEDRYSNSTYATWYQVSTLTDDCLMTAQVGRNGDTSQGRLVISNVPTVEPGAPLGDDLLKPAGAEVVSDLSTRDGHKSGRVSVLACGGTAEEVASFYRANMSRGRWSLAQDFRKDQARVLAFRDGLDSSNVLIIPAGDIIQVLINSETID